MSHTFIHRIELHIEAWAYTLTRDQDPDTLVDQLDADGIPDHQINQIVALAELTTELAQLILDHQTTPTHAQYTLATQFGLDPAIAHTLLTAAHHGIHRAQASDHPPQAI